MKTPQLYWASVGIVLLLWLAGNGAQADCTLTNLGVTPLNDLGFGIYRGFTGGLYPNGANSRPPAHKAAGLNIAVNQIRPRNLGGYVDTNNGKIVLLSIGMSNTTQEYATGSADGTDRQGAFKPRADSDPSKNPQLVIVDGAQGGQDAPRWTNFNALTWSNVQQRLAMAGVSSNQVQVIWMKHALARPNDYGAFPRHAQGLQADLEMILRVAKARFPNLAMAYVSSRTRAYVTNANSLNPEPFAYESAFSVRWLLQKQLDSNLNYDPAQGAAVVPWLSWGPYLWADGANPRSDGFVWDCSDTRANEFTHPSHSGVRKVADELLAFFKTDPTTTPWFLRKTLIGQPPVCAPVASTNTGLAPLTVNFLGNASDPDGPIRSYEWTFDDGDFSTNANPIKIFPAPGVYHARLTVTDTNGNTASGSATVTMVTTFELWRQAKFTATELTNSTISGFEADPDGDGISNELEYLLGSEPKTPDRATNGLPKAAI